MENAFPAQKLRACGAHEGRAYGARNKGATPKHKNRSVPLGWWGTAWYLDHTFFTGIYVYLYNSSSLHSFKPSMASHSKRQSSPPHFLGVGIYDSPPKVQYRRPLYHLLHLRLGLLLCSRRIMPRALASSLPPSLHLPRCGSLRLVQLNL